MNDISVSHERFGDFIKFSCKFTQSFIMFKTMNNNICYENSELDWENPKIILNMLKSSFMELEKQKFDKFRYIVNNNELCHIDITKWTVIEKKTFTTLLECSMTDAFANIVAGFIS